MLRTRDLDESELPFGGNNSTAAELQHFEIPYVYFGIFDGHAGSATAVTAANELHQVSVFVTIFLWCSLISLRIYIFLQIVHKRLMGVLRHLTNQMHGGGSGGGGGVMWYPTKDISLESLVIGLKIVL